MTVVMFISDVIFTSNSDVAPNLQRLVCIVSKRFTCQMEKVKRGTKESWGWDMEIWGQDSRKKGALDREV